ncbi:hypothetical protein C0J52_20899 [Blattella germanica]|nr:hypothetical protein C0J52_20899 [Blattella germanica]
MTSNTHAGAVPVVAWLERAAAPTGVTGSNPDDFRGEELLRFLKPDKPTPKPKNGGPKPEEPVKGDSVPDIVERNYQPNLDETDINVPEASDLKKPCDNADLDRRKPKGT